MSDRVMWTMVDGTKIPIEELTTSHLKNIIRMVIRRADALRAKTMKEERDSSAMLDLFPDGWVCDTELWQALIAECDRRGDSMGQFSVERAVDTVLALGESGRVMAKLELEGKATRTKIKGGERVVVHRDRVRNVDV